VTITQAISIALLLTIFWGGMTQIFAPERLEGAFASENEQAARWIGEKRAASLYETSKGIVSPLFGDSAQPTPVAAADELSLNLTGASIRDLEPILSQALFRIMVTGIIFLFVVPFIVGVIVDGFAIRAVKREFFQSESPRVYHLSKHILIAVIIAPFLIAALPIGIGPPLAIAWSVLVMLTCWGMAQNVEQEV